ncbi:MAG: riboflavin biosynthesis protein ribF [Gammaproteobacteria bacterium]|nr:riboflavin biosynthesis protein ribF [Gammaproteobacteria bacterium]MCE3238034.1 riboflavin biosynthesis protein ribF [Gammaproteobacteria bacterium]
MSTQLVRRVHSSNGFTSEPKGCVATIGNFDGVHQGHQALLKQVILRAKELNLSSRVMIFEPQPAEFFLKDKCIARLTRFREKFYYLAKEKVDEVWVVLFNKALALLTATEFIEHVLCAQLYVKHLIVGEDFRFGQGRKGDVALLKAKGQQLGFTVETMPSVMIEGERVSSTRVRNALANADHLLAEQLLGRPYCMLGRVVYGNQLGRTLGFPTANIYLHRRVTPIHGIYAVRLHGIAKKGLPGVANIGIRPTIGGTRTLLEVHVFDFSQTIYGSQVCVEFCKKLREEAKFENLELLKAQMCLDAAEARHYFMRD